MLLLVCQVIKSLSGPPNYWDPDRIENNMFKRYNRKDLDGTLYDAKSIMHYRYVIASLCYINRVFMLTQVISLIFVF